MTLYDRVHAFLGIDMTANISCRHHILLLRTRPSKRRVLLYNGAPIRLELRQYKVRIKVLIGKETR